MNQWINAIDNPWMEWSLIALFVLAGAWISFHLTRLILVRLIHRLSSRMARHATEALKQHRVVEMLSWIAPALVFYHAVLLVPEGYQIPFERASHIYLTLVLMIFIGRLLSATMAIYEQLPLKTHHPIKGYVQLVKLIVYLFGVIIVFTTLLGVSPWGVLSGLGALMALLLLIFRDTILSFLASLQIAANDLVRVGDWIEAPHFGADGGVIDIALHHIQVQNWDRTIITIPTYKLVEHAFKNWRGMQQSGGRRIMRAIWLDINSFRFLTAEEIERLEQVALLRGYLQEKKEAIETYNRTHPEAGRSPLNGRHLSNIGTFRAYASAYLAQHSALRQDMTLMVRQLAPTAQGLGLEIYCFTADTAWVNYEAIQADIFDHLLVALGEFDLRVFQNPSGRDFTALVAADRPPSTP